MADYAHPEALVSTEWVASMHGPQSPRGGSRRRHEGVRRRPCARRYRWAWNTQLCDTVRRDILVQGTVRRAHVDFRLIPERHYGDLYGDNNNWFAAWALWQTKMYGHKDVRLMNGGRKKWLAEGREVSPTRPRRPRQHTTPPVPIIRCARFSIRCRRRSRRSHAMVDVRSPQEFTGEILAPPGLPETCQRGGHIPDARSIPWGKACNEDGTFKSADELKSLYGGEGMDGSKPVIAYCRIGERSSHTWFVLKYLLGYDRVLNYDGSWTEWGNLVGAPVERGTASAKA